MTTKLGPIVAVMIDRLNECWADDSGPFDLDQSVVVEFLLGRLNKVFAYQFMRVVPDGAGLLTIATYIPSEQVGSRPLLQIQQPGGRPYSRANPVRLDICREICEALRVRYPQNPILQINFEPKPGNENNLELELAQLEVLHALVKRHGVIGTMDLLGKAVQKEHEVPHDRPV
ncbi:MAG: hypothetical protein ACYCZ6_17495 [Polaromonas sp.]